MIKGIAQVALIVREYNEAKNYYCQKLGFTVAEDTLLAGGKRWVRLRAPGGAGSELVLTRAVDERTKARAGNQTGGPVLFFLHTDDFEADFGALQSKGVKFVEQPRDEPYGRVAVFLDLYGNRVDLIEPK